MKKILIILGIVIMSLALMGGCQTWTSASLGLEIQDAVFAKMINGELTPLEEPIFNRGDDVYYVLLNVGQFMEGEDGKSWIDIDIEVKNPAGEVILEKRNLLGDEGKVYLENGIAKTPFGVYESPSDIPPGKYKMTIHIFDNIGRGMASRSGTFELV